MISGKCFMKGCMSQPRSKCECNNNTTLFCDLHALDHIKTPSKTGHVGLDLYFRPSWETKRSTAIRALSLIADLHRFKAEFLHKGNDITNFLLELIQNTLSQLDKIEKDCKNILQIALSSIEILDVPTESRIEKILKLSKEEAEIELESWEIPKLAIDTENIKSFLKNNLSIELEIFKDSESICKSNTLWFFDNNLFNKFDLDTFQAIPDIECFEIFKSCEESAKYINSIPISKPQMEEVMIMAEIIEYQTQIIQEIYNFHALPTGQVLIYKNNSCLYLIDRNSNIIQIGYQNFHGRKAGFTYFKNSVYMFGCYTSSKFDLQTYEWKNLAASDQTCNFSSTSCIGYQNKIIIVDSQLAGVLIYDIEKNNYSFTQIIRLQQRYHKLILKGNGRLYLIEFGSNIYESNYGDAKIWNVIGSNNLPNEFICSSISQYNGNIYFLTSFQLWKFNFKSRNVDIVDADPFKRNLKFRNRNWY